MGLVLLCLRLPEVTVASPFGRHGADVETEIEAAEENLEEARNVEQSSCWQRVSG